MNLLGHYLSTPLEGGPLGRQGSSVLYTLVPHRYTQVPRYHTAGLGGAGATTEIQWGGAQSQQWGGAGRVPLGVGQKEGRHSGARKPRLGMGEAGSKSKVRRPAKEHALAQDPALNYLHKV